MADHAGYSEETCVKCGWKMGDPPVNCQNNNTPHRFPSQVASEAVGDYDERTTWLLNLVGTELCRARSRFRPMNSPHEGKAVIEEELDEFWEHCKANTGRESAAMDEAIQVAAMAARFVFDLAAWGPSGVR